MLERLMAAGQKLILTAVGDGEARCWQIEFSDPEAPEGYRSFAMSRKGLAKAIDALAQCAGLFPEWAVSPYTAEQAAAWREVEKGTV
jgi:hypothetical protein